MDPAGLIGLAVALGTVFVVMLIEGTPPMAIVLPGPLLLVWVTTLAVGLMGHTLKDAMGSFAAVPTALRSKAPDPSGTIETLVSLADKATPPAPSPTRSCARACSRRSTARTPRTCG